METMPDEKPTFLKITGFYFFRQILMLKGLAYRI